MNKFKRLNGAVKASAIVVLTLVLTGALVLIAAEKAERGFLGVSVQRLADEEMEKIGVTYGVQVLAVNKDSAAAKAGILKGDVIQAVNGEKIRDTQTLSDVIREMAPGSTAKIGLWRDGKALEVKAVLGKFESQRHFTWHSAPMTKVIRSRAYLGINLLEMDADMASYFSVKAGEGVLITRVEKDTPAEKAGLKSGDVIVQMGAKAVKESDDIHEALASLKKGDSLEITVVRHGKRVTLKADPDFSRKERVLRFFSGDKDIEIEHLELPELDIEIPEFDIEIPAPPAPPAHEEILRKVQEKMDNVRIKIDKRLKHVSENYWI
jgi:serine protease Do